MKLKRALGIAILSILVYGGGIASVMVEGGSFIEAVGGTAIAMAVVALIVVIVYSSISLITEDRWWF